MSLYKDRVAAGLCGTCGKPSDTGGPVCTVDQEKARVREAAKRDRNRKKKGCLGCGKPVVVGTKCDDCKAKAKASRQRSIASRKAKGQCVNCKKPAKPGCTLCQDHIDELSATASKHYARRKAAGLCYYCNNPPESPGGTTCARHRAYTDDYRTSVKAEAFDAYGGPTCAGCGNQDFEVLEIDHIEGGGGKHRREIGIPCGGYNFYLWLRRNGYPAGFRVLCPTCNKKAYRGLLAPTSAVTP